MLRWKLYKSDCVMDIDANGEYVEYVDAMQEIEQLKEVLKKCNPYRFGWDYDGIWKECNFCGGDDGEHEPNCEYLKLIGGTL
jgi:hypothetical protein